jgi:poly(3-hydroxybutyrate) depolymerase
MPFAKRFDLVLSLAVCLAAAGCGGGGASRSASAPVPLAPDGAARSTDAVTTPGVHRLGSYEIDREKVFVAGISSGGFFGVQMHVAHSRTFKGAAIYAGGVYYCALGNVITALTACGGEGLYASTLAASETYLNAQSAAGTIDDVRNLREQPVYLWSGTQDTVVKQAEMNDLQTEYKHYGADIVKYDNAFAAQHGWESPDGELSCGTLGSPFMINCNAGSRAYDSERTWLSAFFEHLRPRNDGRLRGHLVNFDQTEFGAAASNSMDTNGYYFVPERCSERHPCGLVVAFHGCLQTQADIGTKFITESGIDEWADSNDIIVLYPYAVKSTTVPFNPQGCWDWWGYDDPNYALKSGTQTTIVYKMVQRLMER